MNEEQIKQKIKELNVELSVYKMILNSDYTSKPQHIYEKVDEIKKQKEFLELQLIRLKKLNKIL